MASVEKELQQIRPTNDDKLRRPRTDVSVRLIKFDQDLQDPYTWTKRQKWTSILMAVTFSWLTAVNITAYTQTYPSMLPELNISQTSATLANTGLFVTVAIGPTILSPISEEVGRKPMLVATGILWLLLFIPLALAKNLGMLITFRTLQGLAASGANTLVGGLVADVFAAEERAMPMGLYTLAIFYGQAVGAIVFAWVNTALGFRWVNWIQMMMAGVSLFGVVFIMKETRGPAMLQAKARKLTHDTGIDHVARVGQQKSIPLSRQIKTASTRAIVFLVTEPIVGAMAIWIGTIWGILFLFFIVLNQTYSETYGFNQGEQGLVFIAFLIGSTLGAAGSQWSDRLWQRDARKQPNGKAPPESRLYASCVCALLVPISVYMFAWTGQSQIHWIVPTIALVLFQAGVLPIYLAAFSYLGDSYEMYASSAMSAQSLLRNIMAGVMPLSGPALYRNLGSKYAGTLLGSLILIFAPLPFLLMKYGARIRANSRVATQIARQQEEERLVAEKYQARQLNKKKLQDTEADRPSNSV